MKVVENSELRTRSVHVNDGLSALVKATQGDLLLLLNASPCVTSFQCPLLTLNTQDMVKSGKIKKINQSFVHQVPKILSVGDCF